MRRRFGIMIKAAFWGVLIERMTLDCGLHWAFYLCKAHLGTNPENSVNPEPFFS